MFARRIAIAAVASSALSVPLDTAVTRGSTSATSGSGRGTSGSSGCITGEVETPAKCFVSRLPRREHTKSVALIPQCAECETAWLPANEERWQAWLTCDEPPELAFYCPEC